MTIKRTRAFFKWRADADRLAELFERGTLLDIIDELDDPLWTAQPRRHKDYLPSPEVPVDAIGSRGLTLLGEALTTPRPLEFRLALLCILLARGAQPCTVSETGRSIAWAIEQVALVDSYAAIILAEVVKEAQELWNDGHPFEIPPGIDEWIREELDLLRQQPEEVLASPSPALPEEAFSSTSPPPPPHVQQDQEQRPEPSSPLPNYVDEDTPMTTDAMPKTGAPANTEAMARAASSLQGSVPGPTPFERLSKKAIDGVAAFAEGTQAPATLAREPLRPSPSFSVSTDLVKSSAASEPEATRWASPPHSAFPSGSGQDLRSARDTSSSVPPSSPVSRASSATTVGGPGASRLPANSLSRSRRSDPHRGPVPRPRSSLGSQPPPQQVSQGSATGLTFAHRIPATSASNPIAPTGPKPTRQIPTGPKANRPAPSGQGSKEMWLCFLDPNLTPALLEHYLKTGPETYLSVTRDEWPLLQALVDVGSCNKGGPVAPPYPRRVEVSTYSNPDFVKKYGAAVGHAEYGSVHDADEAREIFDGRRMFGGADWARDQRPIIWRTEKPRA